MASLRVSSSAPAALIGLSAGTAVMLIAFMGNEMAHGGADGPSLRFPWSKKTVEVPVFEQLPRVVPERIPRLYVFDHCEFCTRARMVFGLKNIAVELVFPMYDKAEKLVALAGKRITPILEIDAGEAMTESLDIVKWVDYAFGPKLLAPSTNRSDINEWLSSTSMLRRKLTRPRFVRAYLPEFVQKSARDYYVETHPFTAACGAGGGGGGGGQCPPPGKANATSSCGDAKASSPLPEQDPLAGNDNDNQDSTHTHGDNPNDNGTSGSASFDLSKVLDMRNCDTLGPDLDDLLEDYQEKFDQTPKFKRQINKKLRELNKMIASVEHASPKGLSIDDITLFSSLRPLTLVKGIKFGSRLEAYMRAMSQRADVPLYFHCAL